MTALELVEQLGDWGGEARFWQLRAAFDYTPDLDWAVFIAIIAGAVEVELECDPERDPEDDIVRLTRRFR